MNYLNVKKNLIYHHYLKHYYHKDNQIHFIIIINNGYKMYKIKYKNKDKLKKKWNKYN